MCSSADGEGALLDGHTAVELAHRLALPRVLLYASVGSTLDIAHRVAADSPSGTLIVADEQTAGRGRHGRRWSSEPGAGLWLTLIERPTDARALDVLALRCGLEAAEALEPLAQRRVCLKWPNDLYLDGRKLAGILIETRWRGTAPDWVAIGFGLNVLDPHLDTATGLPEGVSRLAALDVVVPALRRAAAAPRHLSDAEMVRWKGRDASVDRLVTEPAVGRVAGIAADGQLCIAAQDGTQSRHRTGSLTFADSRPLSCS